MGEYIILSGAYGTDINFYVNSVLRTEDNKKSYILNRLFPDYEVMKIRYPTLKDKKALLPVFWGVRILSSVFDVKRIKEETTGIVAVEDSAKKEQEQFLNKVGL